MADLVAAGSDTRDFTPQAGEHGPSLQGQCAIDRADGDIFALAFGEVAANPGNPDAPLRWNYQMGGVWKNPTAPLCGPGGIVSTDEVRAQNHILLDGFGHVDLIYVKAGLSELRAARCINPGAPENPASWKHLDGSAPGAQTVVQMANPGTIYGIVGATNVTGDRILVAYRTRNDPGFNPSILGVFWNGTVWSAPFPIYIGNGGEQVGGLCLDADGHWHATWRKESSLYYARNTQGIPTLHADWKDVTGTFSAPSFVHPNVGAFEIAPGAGAAGSAHNGMCLQANNRQGPGKRVVAAFLRDTNLNFSIIGTQILGQSIDPTAGTATDVLIEPDAGSAPTLPTAAPKRNRYPALQCDAKDNFYCAYARDTNVPASNPSPGAEDVVVRKSPDGGLTWSMHAVVRDDASHHSQVSMPLARLPTFRASCPVSWTDEDAHERLIDSFPVEAIPQIPPLRAAGKAVVRVQASGKVA